MGARGPEPGKRLSAGDRPAVSVVVPVRDGERFVEAALRSVLDQEGVGFELIVVDDGSTDTTPEILDRLARADARVRVLCSGGAGLTPALRIGTGAARGALIARQDADDLWLPGTLRLLVDQLEDAADLVVVGGQVELMSEGGDAGPVSTFPTDRDEIAGSALSRCPFSHSAVCFRADALRAVGGYRLEPSAEDFDLWVRLLEVGAGANVDVVISRHRIHRGQVTVQRFDALAVATCVARASALVRRAGRPDPLGNGRTVADRDCAERLGITDAEITREHASLVAWKARQMSRTGDHAAARELLNDALRSVPGDRSGRRMLLDTSARLDHERGHRFRARIARGRERLLGGR